MNASPRGRGRLPWLGILIPLALGFVLSLALAYQTWDAAREHRVAAEATVRDHAAFAAHLIAGRIDGQLAQTMFYAFYRVDLAIREGERWPAVEALASDQEIRRCESERTAEERVYFRYLDGELEVTGAAHADLHSWLATWVDEAVGSYSASRPYGLRFDAPGIGSSGLAYRVFRHAEGTALYGLDNCFLDDRGNVLVRAVEEPGVLPPSLVKDTPNDSLFVAAVLGAPDEYILGEHPAYDSPYTVRFRGMAPVDPTLTYDGMSVVVEIRQAVAQRLVVGGIPRSRLPEAFGLVVLTALLLVIAARQIRRGQELIRLREQFVSNVTHELRTPLQQILLFADLLRLRRVSTEDERDQAVSVIHRETRRLINLVENVLSFSRPTGDAANARETAVFDLAGTVVESFRPIAEERGVDLRLRGEEVVVRGDPEGLQRVLLNLLDNAVKYGPDGQTVMIEVSRRAGFGVISVRDEGPGIPSDDRERIWDAYFRLSRESRANSTGQGVGLAIVRDLVEKMGGRVGVENAQPVGACFEVELPVVA